MDNIDFNQIMYQLKKAKSYINEGKYGDARHYINEVLFAIEPYVELDEEELEEVFDD